MSDALPCHRCQAPATVHLTQIMDGKVLKLHLCEACAAHGGTTEAHVFKLDELLAPGAGAVPVDTAPVGLTCPGCGQTEVAFRKNARFGCVTCYTVFSEHLAGLLPRIQLSLAHTGKHPASARVHAIRAELRRARAELASAIRAEHYEEAGRLRDRIRLLETEDAAYAAGVPRG